jgi:hypothetical protein
MHWRGESDAGHTHESAIAPTGKDSTVQGVSTVGRISPTSYEGSSDGNENNSIDPAARGRRPGPSRIADCSLRRGLVELVFELASGGDPAEQLFIRWLSGVGNPAEQRR